MPIKCKFCGIQEGIGHIPSSELWTILEPVGIHPAGSTISITTINRHGYVPVSIE